MGDGCKRLRIRGIKQTDPAANSKGAEPGPASHQVLFGGVEVPWMLLHLHQF